MESVGHINKHAKTDKPIEVSFGVRLVWAHGSWIVIVNQLECGRGYKSSLKLLGYACYRMIYQNGSHVDTIQFVFFV